MSSIPIHFLPVFLQATAVVRKDRREETWKELRNLNLKPIRIDAVKFYPGSLGCTLSHIKALEIAKLKNWKHVMICEDDIEFTENKKVLVQQFDTFLSRHNDWDVITLGANINEAVYVDDSCARILSSFCTTCYIVRQEYYDVLLNNFKMAAHKMFHKFPGNHEIDVEWHSLQKRDMWYTILPIVAVQRISASDIAGSPDQKINYQNSMISSSLGNIQNYPDQEKTKVKDNFKFSENYSRLY